MLLTLSTLGKIFSSRFFSYFAQKTGFGISGQFPPICMKCQILFSGKNKNNSASLSSAELAQRVVKVKRFEKSGLLFEKKKKK